MSKNYQTNEAVTNTGLQSSSAELVTQNNAQIIVNITSNDLRDVILVMKCFQQTGLGEDFILFVNEFYPELANKLKFLYFNNCK